MKSIIDNESVKKAKKKKKLFYSIKQVEIIHYKVGEIILRAVQKFQNNIN